MVVVHRAKEKAKEKGSASAKGDRAIAREPHSNGIVQPGAAVPNFRYHRIQKADICRQHLEVALYANLQQKRILILELVERGRLRSGRSEHRAARHLLVEVEPLDFGRERQVLDGCPAEVDAELRDVEVGVAGVVACSVSDQCLTAVAGGESGAIGALGRGGSSTEQVVVGSAVIPDGRVAAEQAASTSTDPSCD